MRKRDDLARMAELQKRREQRQERDSRETIQDYCRRLGIPVQRRIVRSRTAR